MASASSSSALAPTAAKASPSPSTSPRLSLGPAVGSTSPVASPGGASSSAPKAPGVSGVSATLGGSPAKAGACASGAGGAVAPVLDKNWPMGKLQAALARGCASRPFLAAILVSARLSPVHRGHLDAVCAARNRLEALGYAVVGCWLSPWNDNEMKASDIKAPFRVKLAQLVAQDDPLLDVGTWETSGAKPSTATSALIADRKDLRIESAAAASLQAAIHAAAPQHRDWMHVFCVIGSDQWLEGMDATKTEQAAPPSSPRPPASPTAIGAASSAVLAKPEPPPPLGPPPAQPPLPQSPPPPSPAPLGAPGTQVAPNLPDAPALPAAAVAAEVVAAKERRGVVVLARAGAAAPPDQPRSLMYSVMLSCSSVSGHALRTALAIGDFATFAAGTPASIARLLAAPAPDEWKAHGSELAKLGVKAPRGAEAQETQHALPEPAAAKPSLALPNTKLPAGGQALAKPGALASGSVPKLTDPKLASAKPLGATAAKPASAGLAPLGSSAAAGAKAAVPTRPCASCGHQSAMTAKFCSECGTKFPPQPPPLQAPKPILPPPPPLEPGAIAKSGGIALPKAATLRTLEALDKVVAGLQRQGLKLENVFRRLDVDGSGALQRNEFVGAMQTFLGLDATADDLMEMWMAADVDQDGKVTLEEFLDFFGKLPSHVADAKKLREQAKAKAAANGAEAPPPAKAAATAASTGLAISENSGKWIPPEVLWVASPSGQSDCAGEYRLDYASLHPGSGKAGAPRWKKLDAEFWLYRGNLGFWCIGGSQARDRNFDCSSCYLYRPGPQRSDALPDTLPPYDIRAGAWQRWDDRAARWQLDFSVSVSEVLPHAGAERTRAALREVARLRSAPREVDAEKRAAELALLDVDLTDWRFSADDGSTVLALAASEGWLDLAQALCTVAPSSRPGYIDEQGPDTGWTALLGASRRGQHATVTLLLRSKASANLASARGQLTPLMLAAHGGYLSIVQALLASKAAPSAKCCGGRSAADYARERLASLSTSGGVVAAGDQEAPARFSEVVRVLEDATASAAEPTPEVAAELAAAAETAAAARRRRKRRVTYDAGQAIGISWSDDVGGEVCVQSLPPSEPAYLAGVRPGWSLLGVGDVGAEPSEDPLQLPPGPQRLRAVRALQPPVTLEFGRPLHYSDDVWMTALAGMMGSRRRPPGGPSRA
eukprot:TRINITY_DN22974_c0_g1_i1.p1 TRINITY_DN22974_c0_g1~~TRINITY_DN22974_c0_g1_i1.p1  ORF type:complete len:1175 (-),score=219.27 TRINITY_DN22974_c0_g1_i1:45-3569(-)